jgi:hypothetical protein
MPILSILGNERRELQEILGIVQGKGVESWGSEWAPRGQYWDLVQSCILHLELKQDLKPVP